MNTPGVESGQWTFRVVPWMLATSTAMRLRDMVETYERIPSAAPAALPASDQ